jgi:hypothetical protein
MSSLNYMLSLLRKISESELNLNIMMPNLDNKNLLHYEFYDSVHINPRLTIIVQFI